MVTLDNIVKSFGDTVVFNGLSLDFEVNQTTAILGESGCGKTTLLKIIAKTIAPDSGKVVSPDKISFVFQDDRLLPNLTVQQNLELVAGKGDYDELLSSVGLLDKKFAYPDELSGGMARRLNFLRAFVYPSSLILLDEPFRGLDLKIKYSVMDTFTNLMKKSPRTALLVTHSPDEAEYLSKRAIVLSNGGSVLADIDNPKAQELKKILITGEAN
ncbi:MAG: ABC transporter ATP-binding protein [Clostridia bacterium]|nr:ABC transporter ATP-binding protein [Clostridia bacterium]